MKRLALPLALFFAVSLSSCTLGSPSDKELSGLPLFIQSVIQPKETKKLDGDSGSKSEESTEEENSKAEAIIKGTYFFF